MSKTGGSLFGPKESDRYFPCYGAVMKFDQICDQIHDCSIAWEIAVQFFWAKMWLPPVFYVLMCFISTNILTVLANFLAIIIQKRKNLKNISHDCGNNICFHSQWPTFHGHGLLPCHLWFLDSQGCTIYTFQAYHTTYTAWSIKARFWQWEMVLGNARGVKELRSQYEALLTHPPKWGGACGECLGSG